ncbi:MAG: DNA-directed RNA polymerase subunit omega [Microcoleaceae cyanobacterium]
MSTYELHSRAEKLIQSSPNRYQVSVQVARRAQRIKAELFESDENLVVRPVIQAIIEISDELTLPKLISDD